MTAAAPNYDRTVVACFNGYITQAVINNFMPLLFVTFSASFGIDMAQLSTLISVNFVTQLVVDVLAGKYVDRIGYRPCIIAAHVAAAAGLLTLGLLPTRVADPYPSPMPDILPEGTSSMKLGELVRNPLFAVFFVMMLCAGASELGMSQWASTFAETGLGVSKTIGDLGCTAGPAIVGTVAAANGDSLQAGLLVGVLFPVILLVGVIALRQILYTTRRAG